MCETVFRWSICYPEFISPAFFRGPIFYVLCHNEILYLTHNTKSVTFPIRRLLW